MPPWNQCGAGFHGITSYTDIRGFPHLINELNENIAKFSNELCHLSVLAVSQINITVC